MYCLDLEGFTASRLLAAITLFALADSLLSPDVLNCVTKGKHQQGTMDVAHLKSKKLLSLSPRSFQHPLMSTVPIAMMHPSESVAKVQVHSNALFFPPHRAYLYFFERFLSSLIGNPDFAIPFWNWDTPDGMYNMTEPYNDPNSSLYDKFRDPLLMLKKNCFILTTTEKPKTMVSTLLNVNSIG
ncbi:hypothetical protein Csa_013729 [Cucumis sativus]|nr:hypothetical protein Csa_013729 [Cucumis sativus]